MEVHKMKINKNYSYITLLSSIDYLEAVLVLNRSLKQVRSKYPFAVAIPQPLINKEIIEILEKEKIIIKQIPWLEYNNITKKSLEGYNNLHVFNTGSKIEIFGLIEFDKLVYLDADSIVIKNIDKLFKYKDGSSIINQADNKQECFNALYVFKPSNHPLNYYKTILKYENANDGELMANIWWQIKDNKSYKIPEKYFYIPFYEIKWNKVKAYHLLGDNLKYWNLEKIPNNKLANYYNNFLESIRNDYKIELKKIKGEKYESYKSGNYFG